MKRVGNFAHLQLRASVLSYHEVLAKVMHMNNLSLHITVFIDNTREFVSGKSKYASKIRIVKDCSQPEARNTCILSY